MTAFHIRPSLAALAFVAALAVPTHAAGAPAAEAPAKPAAEAPAKAPEAALYDSEVFKTYIAVVRELSPLVDDNDPRATIEALGKFDFSPETKQKLSKLFGNDKPMHITTSVAADGGNNVDFLLDPLHYDSEDGKTHADWSGVTARSVYDKSYMHAEMNGHSDAFTLSAGDGKQVLVKNMTLHSSTYQDAAKLWLGAADVGVESITLGSGTSPVNLDGIALKATVAPEAKALNLDYDVSIKSISWGDEKAGPVKLALRFSHIDEQAFAQLKDESRKLNTQQLDPQVRSKQSLELFKRFGAKALEHGVGLEIKTFAVQYHGKEAGLSGRVQAKPVSEAELQSFDKFSKKVSARFEVHVPLAMAEDVAATFVRQMSKGQSAPEMTEEQMHDMARAMVQGQLKKPETQRYVRIDHDMIRSTLEFKAGKLLVNGHNIEMPVFKKPAAAPKKG